MMVRREVMPAPHSRIGLVVISCVAACAIGLGVRVIVDRMDRAHEVLHERVHQLEREVLDLKRETPSPALCENRTGVWQRCPWVRDREREHEGRPRVARRSPATTPTARRP